MDEDKEHENSQLRQSLFKKLRHEGIEIEDTAGPTSQIIENNNEENTGCLRPEINFNRYRRGLETCPQAKTSKSGHAIFFFFPTRPSDECDSAPSRKYSRPLLDNFACIG